MNNFTASAMFTVKKSIIFKSIQEIAYFPFFSHYDKLSFPFTWLAIEYFFFNI